MTSRRSFLSACAVTPLASAFAKARNAPPRMAMWVWKDRVLSPGAMLAFAERRGISTLFVYVTPTAAEALLTRDRDACATLRAMRSNGRRVYAVAGEPDWAWGPAQLPEHAALLVRLAVETGLFDGLHFDVEPNAVPDWNDKPTRPALMKGSVKFYDLLRAAAPYQKIDIAVNPVFATLTTGGSNFMRELARRADSLSIMSYRSDPKRALEWAAPAIAQIEGAGRRWRMGAEVGDAEPGVTWRGTPPARFSSAMVDFDNLITDRFRSPRYEGLALHDYDSLAQMYGEVDG